MASGSTVSVAAHYGSASELGPTPGMFRLTRTGDLSAPLTVNIALSGTATKNTDYLAWENSARFEAGSDRAFLTILPVNDTLVEGAETVIVTVTAGTGYTVGTPASATVTIADYSNPKYPGVWDPRQPSLTSDLVYFEAGVASGKLVVRFAGALTNANVELWIDADQDPATGDIRQGHAAGAEYRVHISTIAGISYELWRLPQQLSDCSPHDGNCAEQIVIPFAFGRTDADGAMRIEVPLSALGNPAAVDVFATTWSAAAPSRLVAEGDRAPEYGAIDSRTGRVVVRRPGVSNSRYLSDARGDGHPLGFDLTGVQFDTLADQLYITAFFAQTFNPESFAYGPAGQVVMDSDRSLLTSGFAMLDKEQGIPTWGGDVRLKFEIGAFGTGADVLQLQFDNTGSATVIFGQQSNDCRWATAGTGGNVVQMVCSLAVFDARRRSTSQLQRVPADGRFLATVDTLYNSEMLADSLPGAGRVADSLTGRIHSAFAWTSPLSIADPVEYLGAPGVDLIRVDTQIVDGHLVVKGVVKGMFSTDHGNYYEILLDTDMNAATSYSDPWSPSGRWNGIGADYKVDIFARDGIAPVYVANLVTPDGQRVIGDSMLDVRTATSAFQGASFTVTIPLPAIGNPSQLRFLVTSGNLTMARQDTAPDTPITIIR
jgi:hypothetical protein